MLPPIEHGETRLVQVRIFAIIFIWEIRQDSRGLGQGLESFFLGNFGSFDFLRSLMELNLILFKKYHDFV